MEFFSALGGWCGGTGLWQNGGMGGWQGWMPFHFGGIFQILIIGLIIFFVARMVRKPTTTTGAPLPRDILKRRYASGEIDKETYDRMKDELQ